MTTEARSDAPPLAQGRLLVVGAGTMGQQIALQAALQGCEVVLTDVSSEQLESAFRSLRELVDVRVAKQRLTRHEAATALARLELSSELSAVAPTCAWAIEAVVERLDVKRTVFAELVAALPGDAGLATNSSHIRAATISEGEDWADRCMNMHFFHPVLVMDLVEIVASDLTGPAYIEKATAWSHRIGRTPVVLHRDLDGFLVNRILGQASREAFALLGGGVASFEDIDIAVTRGLRWPMGPFQLADLSGLDVLFQSRSDRYEKHGDPGDLVTVEILRPLIDQGCLGRKSGAGFYDYASDPPRPRSVQLPSESPEP